jgi:NUDIX domain
MRTGSPTYYGARADKPPGPLGEGEGPRIRGSPRCIDRVRAAGRRATRAAAGPWSNLKATSYRSFEDGVRREILEGTGIPVEVQQLTGVYKNMHRNVVALVFRCHPLGERHRATAEAADVRWADPEEIVRLMAPAYVVRVTDALSNSTTVTRAHDGVHLIDA